MEIIIPSEMDFEKINVIAKQVHDLHVEWRPDLFISVDTPILKEVLTELIQNKEIYVVKESDTILGYITINIKEKEPYHGMYYRKILTIEAIGVDKNCQSKGIGKQLMNYVISIAKEQGCNTVALTVNEENTTAIKFYEKLGMKVKNISYSMKI